MGAGDATGVSHMCGKRLHLLHHISLALFHCFIFVFLPDWQQSFLFHLDREHGACGSSAGPLNPCRLRSPLAYLCCCDPGSFMSGIPRTELCM